MGKSFGCRVERRRGKPTTSFPSSKTDGAGRQLLAKGKEGVSGTELNLKKT